jgi:hypothetical protein
MGCMVSVDVLNSGETNEKKEHNDPILLEQEGDSIYCYFNNPTIFREGDAEQAHGLALYCKAAKLGNINAMVKVARHYVRYQSYYEAVKWFKKAADLDNIVAMFMLSGCYLAGIGISADYDKTMDLYRRLSRFGVAYATYYLAFYYDDGEKFNTRKNKIALQYYKKCIEQINNPNKDIENQFKFYKDCIAKVYELNIWSVDRIRTIIQRISIMEDRQQIDKRVVLIEKIEEKLKKLEDDKEGYYINSSAIECPITTEIMTNPYIINPCGHTFEYTAITQVIEDNNQCPLCKAPIISIIPNYVLKNIRNKY